MKSIYSSRGKRPYVQLLLILLKFRLNPGTPKHLLPCLLLTLGACSFVLGLVPCPAGHVAAALGSSHQMPVAPQRTPPPHTHTPAVTTSSDSGNCQIYSGGRTAPS